MSLDVEWRETWKRDALQIPQCDACGAWNWYPLPACRTCHQSAFTWKRVAPSARLFSWTRVHRDFTGRGLTVPYLVGLAELAAAPGVRLACRIEESPGGDPVIGGSGELVAVGEAESWCWMFRPAG